MLWNLGRNFSKTLLSLLLNDNLITKVNEITYLVKIINKLNFNEIAIEKFKDVQKPVYSLSFLGLQTNSISPKLQSFIYKTYCLSQLTYALENSVLNKDTRYYLNICQNNILRQILGLHKFCHMSNILKCPSKIILMSP